LLPLLSHGMKYFAEGSTSEFRLHSSLIRSLIAVFMKSDTLQATHLFCRHLLICGDFCNDVYENCAEAAYDGQTISKQTQLAWTRSHRFSRLPVEFIVTTWSCPSLRIFDQDRTTPNYNKHFKGGFKVQVSLVHDKPHGHRLSGQSRRAERCTLRFCCLKQPLAKWS